MTTAPDHPITAAPLPPKVRGLPLIGNLPRLFKDPVAFCKDVLATRGDVARIGLGLADVTMISHPDHVKHVLQDASASYGKGKSWEGIRVVIGNSLPASDGAFWLRQRRIMQPAFHRERIAKLVGLMNTAVGARLDGWGASADAGREVDVYLEMRRLTRDVVLTTMFSTSLSPEESAALDTAVDTIVSGLTALMWTGFLPDGVPNPARKRVMSAVATIDKALYRVIEERRRSGGEKDDLLSMLLAARDAETGEAMDDRQLRDEVLGMFVASYEATALTLTWAFYALTQHADAAARLVEEVATLGGRTPTDEDVRKMTYARMVFEESMRFYPPGWVIPRQAVTDDVIGSYRIPKDGIVLICNYFTHRHPDFWERPETFDPEHFTPARAAERAKYAFLPFGGGPRQCIGNTFALTEAQLILVGALQRYEIALAKPVKAKASHVMLRPDPTLWLRVKRRRKGA